MSSLLFTVHAHRSDEQALVDALAGTAHAAIHVRRETVHGSDFSDASTSEKVSGTLDRIALEVVIGEDALDAAVAAIGACRREYPARWMAQPLAGSGRVA
ncbi:DUF3240 family protein [Novosphingobium sp. ZN18A2]|uniref:DUF3240 family protein n=1 Tax=Novosphingobium sp. ZN18A2 TaxID=3079861 RepID=UPI0030CCFEE0